MDKGSLYRLAGEAGLRVPASELVEDRVTLREVAARTTYPCLLKAALSHRYRSVLGDRRVRLVADADELMAAAGEAIDAGLQVLVGEHVPGPETSLEGAVTLRREDGSLALAYTRRKLRQHPPYYGAGAVMEAYPSPEVVAFARQLLDAVGFVGFSSLEAKRHAVTGELVLMEINVRIPQNFGLSVACGVDGPWRVYATLAGIPLGEQPAPRHGAKTIIASLEVHAAGAYVRAGDLTVLDVLRSYRGTRDVSGLSLRDPAPLAAFLTGQARRGLHRAGDALRTRVRAAPAARSA
jgi:predicted ATP-grasp superfamily ATP-dependent carboligase